MADLVFTGQAAGTALNSDAMPGNKDMVIYKGDYVELFVTIKDALDDPIDLTDLTPRAALKLNYEAVENVEFNCTLTANVGEVRIYMPSSLTTTLTSTSYIWDFEILNEDDDSRTYITGDVTVLPQVTDA